MQGTRSPAGAGIIPRSVRKASACAPPLPRPLISAHTQPCFTGTASLMHARLRAASWRLSWLWRLQILEAVALLREQGWEYRLEASYVEVYNEALRDLLAPGNSRRDGARLLDANSIKHDPAGAPARPGPVCCTHSSRRWPGHRSLCESPRMWPRDTSTWLGPKHPWRRPADLASDC